MPKSLAVPSSARRYAPLHLALLLLLALVVYAQAAGTTEPNGEVSAALTLKSGTVVKISRTITDPMWMRMVKESAASSISIDFYTSPQTDARSLGSLSMALPNLVGTRNGTRMLLIGEKALPTSDPEVRSAAWSEAPDISQALRDRTPLYLRASLRRDPSLPAPSDAAPLTLFRVFIALDTKPSGPVSILLTPATADSPPPTIAPKESFTTTAQPKAPETEKPKAPLNSSPPKSAFSKMAT